MRGLDAKVRGVWMWVLNVSFLASSLFQEPRKMGWGLEIHTSLYIFIIFPALGGLTEKQKSGDGR